MRVELAIAFKLNIQVIPVLDKGASMPRYDELTDDLKALALLNAWQVSDANPPLAEAVMFAMPVDYDFLRLVWSLSSIEQNLLRERGHLLVQQGRVEEAAHLAALYGLGGLLERHQRPRDPLSLGTSQSP